MSKKMPYVFRRSDNKQMVVLYMTFSEWQERSYTNYGEDGWYIEIDGVPAKEDPHQSHLARFGRHYHCPGNWPMASDAAGVHPDEVAEFRKIDIEGGVPTEYNSDGNPIFTSKQHRINYCKLHGLYDRNAGYRDPAPVNR